MRLSVRMLLAGACSLSLYACSYGMVTDADTSAKLGGAQIAIDTLNLNGVRADPASFGDHFDSISWDSAMAGAGSGTGSWYLNPYGQVNADDTKKTFVTPGWNRFLVSKSGYDARAFVRNHQYADCQASIRNPYSGGRYPYVGSFSAQNTTAGKCTQQDFALHKSSVNYVKDPDIIVDPRWLKDWSYVTVRGAPHDPDAFSGPFDCEGAASACIRVSVATANVGTGDLEVWAPVGQNTQVKQTRYNRLSGSTDTALSASFVSDGHPHLHLANWTQIRLRRIDSTCSSELTAENCPILPATGHKVSFCLTDFQVFDQGTQPNVYLSNGPHTCGVFGSRIVQGISAGQEDVYVKELSGQYVPADGLHGDFWLEVEVNPADSQGKRTVLESDYTNNVSRLRIKIS